MQHSSQFVAQHCVVLEHEGLAVVAHDDDVDAAVQVHLLQSIHQLTDDVVDLPQRVVQLRGRDTHTHTHALQKTNPTHGRWSERERRRLTHLAAQGSQPVSERVRLL